VRGPGIVVLAGLLLPGAALADDRALLAAEARYLPAARAAYPLTADGLQASYDAGRDLLEAVRAAGRHSVGCDRLRSQLLAVGSAQVLNAEAYDRPVRTGTVPVPRVTASCAPAAARVAPAPPPPLQTPFRLQDRRAAPPVLRDAALDQRLGEVAARFHGTAGVWVHDLRTGRVAGVNEELRFPAASTVKLAVLAAALRDDRRPERSPLFYDAEQIGAWSSNLGANRIVARLGLTAVGEGLRRLGMTSSSYPGLYRAGTSTGPPGVHRRVTTARDLGRALFRLHAAALGRPWAMRTTGLTQPQAAAGRAILLGSQRVGDNAGLLRRWLGGIPLAQKHGWISDVRLTAAIAYRRAGPVIVVVAGYRPGVTLGEAQLLARDVLRAAGLAK
jgi:Beta-lactamase enzyme family